VALHGELEGSESEMVIYHLLHHSLFLFILSLPTYFVFSVPQVKLASAIASQV
jgi:hypothetical protein